VLKQKIDKLSHSYKQMEYAEQGEFHKLVHEWQPKTKL
jgi:hypothetical protein